MAFVAQERHLNKVGAVVGGALGGIVLSQRVTDHILHLSNTYWCAAIFADKMGQGKFEIRRGQEKFVKDRDVLVVEDILTTGDSAKGVVAAVRMAGGNPIAVAAICNRGGVTANNLQVPVLFSLLDLDLSKFTFRAKSNLSGCPMCMKRVPIDTQLGHGREFLKK
jgi:orotate phosphoribosyltransferase